MVLSSKDKAEQIYQQIKEQGFDGQVFQLQVDTQGVRVEK